MWENPKGLYTCRTSLGTFCLHPSPLQILDNCPALPGHVKWEASTAAASVLRPSLIETSVPYSLDHKILVQGWTHEPGIFNLSFLGRRLWIFS